MYKLSQHIIFDTDNESNKKYLIDIENGDLFELNDTASILINYIVNEKEVDEYIDFIYKQLDKEIELEKLKNDTRMYLCQLEEKNIIYEV